MDTTRRFDLAVVGGGLQGGLIALGVLAHDPRRRVAVIDREARPGGNHTWCLHASDVPAAARPWVEPLIAQRWSGYDVRFPTHARNVSSRYSAVTSERFAAHLLATFARHRDSELLLCRGVRHIGADAVVLDDGSTLHATLVVDARGPQQDGFGPCGFQKFLGLELELEDAHGLAQPLLMDATVPQLGGYRFFYVLPMSPTRLLVEDTRFSLDGELDSEALRHAVRSYAARFGKLARVVREETGVLPMPLAGAPPAPQGSPLLAGYRGGFFHPATGYSFPMALRLAQHIATRAPEQVFDRALLALHAAHAAQFRYAARLNRLLFRGFAPEDMWRAFERFYRLPEALIQRFYALQLSHVDRARVLLGRPPTGIRLGAALAAVRP
jgi:lycopene beta-cyclase